MTDREKIIKIIAPFISAYGEDEAIADALIAAGIGDVTEWKEKVACAKRILQIPTLPNGTTDFSYFEYKGERIQDIARQRDEYKHRAEVTERALFNTKKECISAERKIATTKDGRFRFSERLIALVAGEAIKQAEKELAEEGQ